MTREQIETALDAGHVWAKMAHTLKTSWWMVKRNGATKTWKTRPGEFRIPIKIGYKSYSHIDHMNMTSPHLCISKERPTITSV